MVDFMHRFAVWFILDPKVPLGYGCDLGDECLDDNAACQAGDPNSALGRGLRCLCRTGYSQDGSVCCE